MFALCFQAVLSYISKAKHALHFEISKGSPIASSLSINIRLLCFHNPILLKLHRISSAIVKFFSYVSLYFAVRILGSQGDQAQAILILFILKNVYLFYVGEISWI